MAVTKNTSPASPAPMKAMDHSPCFCNFFPPKYIRHKIWLIRTIYDGLKTFVSIYGCTDVEYMTAVVKY